MQPAPSIPNGRPRTLTVRSANSWTNALRRAKSDARTEVAHCDRLHSVTGGSGSGPVRDKTRPMLQSCRTGRSEGESEGDGWYFPHLPCFFYTGGFHRQDSVFTSDAWLTVCIDLDPTTWRSVLFGLTRSNETVPRRTDSGRESMVPMSSAFTVACRPMSQYSFAPTPETDAVRIKVT